MGRGVILTATTDDLRAEFRGFPAMRAELPRGNIFNPIALNVEDLIVDGTEVLCVFVCDMLGYRWIEGAVGSVRGPT